MAAQPAGEAAGGAAGGLQVGHVCTVQHSQQVGLQVGHVCTVLGQASEQARCEPWEPWDTALPTRALLCSWLLELPPRLRVSITLPCWPGSTAELKTRLRSALACCG